MELIVPIKFLKISAFTTLDSDLLFWHKQTALNILSVIAGGCNIEGEEDAYDFGSGAGFYVDATEEKWKTNYRMYSYVTKELRTLVDKYFNTSGKQSITGHRYAVP